MSREAALEVPRREHPVEQLARQRRAGFDVRRHPREHVALPAEILHELAGKLDGIPFDALDAGHAGDLDARQQLVQAVAELVEQRDDFVVRERRRAAVGRCRQVAGEEGDRMLNLRARATAVDRVVLPRAALLAGARVIVEVELADQRARRIGDVEEADVGMPRRRAALADRNAVERFRDAEEAGQHLVFREIAADLLFGERESLRLELLRRIGEIPRREIGEAELGSGERLEFRVVAPGEGFGAAREIAQEAEHFVDALRHLGDERQLGKMRVAEQLRGLAAQLEEARGSPDRCPTPATRRGPKRASRRRGAASRAARGCPRSSSPADSTACAA